jgi:multicomponent Na+:H+ antiporter subunit D
MLYIDVASGNVIHYELGGWQPPWGIEYKIDALNGLMALIITTMALVVMLYAPSSIKKEIPQHLNPLFYSLFQLCLLGLLGISLTGDVFNLFVFLEISSLSSYALIAMGTHRKALLAAFNYLVLGTIGATFFLLGVGMLYAASGSLNMADISQRFNHYQDMQLVTTSLIFIGVGIALKAAIFPLHSWLPQAYGQAPSVVTIFLASTATKVAIYILIRCLFSIFPPHFWMAIFIPDLLIGLGCIAIIYGSARAISQNNMKTLLAYSSIAQIGYFILGIGLLNQAGMTATLLHLFNHALMKSALFMLAGSYFYHVNTTQLSALKGLAKTLPIHFGLLVIAGLSLIGVPGTVGFISKWYLLQSAISEGYWLVVSCILLGSVLAIFYIWKLIETLYFGTPTQQTMCPSEGPKETSGATPWTMLLAPTLVVIGCIYFGIFTEQITTIVTTATQTLWQAMPHNGGGQ